MLHARPAKRPSIRAAACQAGGRSPRASDSSCCPSGPYSGTSVDNETRGSSGFGIASSGAAIHHGSQPRSNPSVTSAVASVSCDSHAPTIRALCSCAKSTPRLAAGSSIARGKLSINWPSCARQDHSRPPSRQADPPPATATARFHSVWLVSHSATVASTNSKLRRGRNLCRWIAFQMATVMTVRSKMVDVARTRACGAIAGAAVLFVCGAPQAWGATTGTSGRVATATMPASVAAHWSKPSNVTGVKLLRAVSCVSRRFCVAVGGGQAVAYRSGAWGRPRTVDRHRGINDGLVTVSCASTKFCVAGDGAGDVFTYNGTRWSAPRLVTTAGLLELSCRTRTFCGAVDIAGDALFYDGVSWSHPQRIPGASQPQVISCPSVGFCMAIDIGSSAYRLSGGSWVPAGSLRTSNPRGGSEPNVASAISCSGRRFCAALDDFGEAFTWSGGGWSRPHRFDANLLAGFDAVSCRSRTACMAVDGSGFATRWNGTTWSPKQRIDRPGEALSDVSCGGARFCIAVDIRAHALIYR